MMHRAIRPRRAARRAWGSGLPARTMLARTMLARTTLARTTLALTTLALAATAMPAAEAAGGSTGSSAGHLGAGTVATSGVRASAGGVRTASAGVRAAALPTVTCRAAEGFSRLTSGPLFRLSDSAPLGAANTMTELGQVGSGWTGTTFAWIGSGGDGVVYGLTWAGEIKWYRYNPGTSSWRPGSGTVIGRGFTPKTKVVNISLGGDGRFYIVRSTGELVIYRHTGRLTGAATWANSSGWKIGTGWTASEILIPNGDGTLYRQYQGALYWYRHTDPALGAVTWRARQTIGSGWKFYDVLPAGGGVLYATEGGSGTVRVYRHADPVGGTKVWAASTGVVKMTARPDSYGITVDPLACTAT